MLSLCIVSGLAYALVSPISGVLHFILILIYHVILVQPLFLLTCLISLRYTKGYRFTELSWPVKVYAVLIVLSALIALWSTLVEPYWLDVEHHTHELSATRAGSRPLRIGVLADLQNDTVGSHQHEVVDTLLAQRPDLILIPGDLYDTDAAQAHIPDFQKLLARLEAPAGVFLVVGDHDDIPTLRQMTRGTDVVLLDDQTTTLSFHDRTIELLGLSLPFRENYDAALDAPTRDPHAIRIVLVHRPRLVQHLSARDDVDLVVAGHTHGGQINVPLFGPPVTISPLPRHIAAGGLHTFNDTPLYISRGVGGVQTVLPLIRLNCRPEVSLIELR